MMLYRWYATQDEATHAAAQMPVADKPWLPDGTPKQACIFMSVKPPDMKPGKAWVVRDEQAELYAHIGKAVWDKLAEWEVLVPGCLRDIGHSSESMLMDELAQVIAAALEAETGEEG